MKNIKTIAIIIAFILFAFLIAFYIGPTSPYNISFIIIISSLIIFNFIVRRFLSFKNYFLSKYNIFTINFRAEKSYEITKEIMFLKTTEVLHNSRFKIIDIDKDKLEILAKSSFTYKSYGENLYISFETEGDKTIMKFCSSTVYQIISYGKNEKNYNDLVIAIEDSLIV